MTVRPRLPLMPLAVGIAILLIAYLGVTTARYVVHNYQARSQESALRTELTQLAEDRRQLEATRDYLKSDEYIEYVARRTLGLVRPGETLVLVSGPERAPEPASTPAPGVAWWKELFGDELSDDLATPTATPVP